MGQLSSSGEDMYVSSAEQFLAVLEMQSENCCRQPVVLSVSSMAALEGWL